MNRSLRRVGFGAAVGLMSAGAWLACSDSSNNSPIVTPDAGSGSDSGNKDAATDTGSHTDSSGSSASSGDAGSSSSGSGSSSSSSGSSSSSADDGGSTDAAADGGTGVDDGSTDGSSDDSNSTDTGLDAGPGLDGSASISCTSYCTLIQTVCTGANAQYAMGASGMTECMNACKYFGTTDAATGNTLVCHYEHAMNAMTLPDPHCWHAGPYGYGVCGAQCEDFCRISTSYCTPDGGYDGDAQPYANLAACTSACPSFASIATASNGIVDGGFNASGPTGGNTRDCREYHLGAALQSTANQQFHCAHVGVTSPTCF